MQAQYAFVIHTTNPSNGNEEEIYAELVAGLGESIVSGMIPGSSLAFVGNKADLDNPRVISPPSTDFTPLSFEKHLCYLCLCLCFNTHPHTYSMLAPLPLYRRCCEWRMYAL